MVSEGDPDFADNRLKTTSVIRIRRIAVVEGSILPGAMVSIAPVRLPLNGYFRISIRHFFSATTIICQKLSLKR